MNRLLLPIEALYRGLNRVRRALYRRGTFSARRLPLPAISVGNIAAGGTGKTPAVITVARILREERFRVAVLTRGYGRQADSPGGIVDRDDPGRFGDEPVLIRRSVPGVDVIVGADRYAGAMEYLRTHQCDVFVLDDGFQHLQLARDLDLVIHAEGRRWMRESAAALWYADAVLLRGVVLQDLPVRVRRSFQAELAIMGVEIDGRREPGEFLSNRTVIAASALADNGQFVESLEELGAEVAGIVARPDHHRWSPADLADLDRLRENHAADLIVTTAKDQVKMGRSDFAVLSVEMRIEPEAELRRLLVETIRDHG